MADPGDLMHAWQEAIKQLRGVAAPVAGATDLIENALRRQLEFEKQLAGQILAPLNVLVDVLDQSASAMRAQAAAFDAAAMSFKQASDLLEVQATLLDQAARSMRDPTQALKAAGGAVAAGTRRARRPPKKKPSPGK